MYVGTVVSFDFTHTLWQNLYILAICSTFFLVLNVYMHIQYLLSPSLAHTPTANGHGSPVHFFNQPQVFTQSLDSRYGPSFPLAAAPPSSSSTADLDLDPEEDNMFAKALRERKLRSVQTNDRSNPVVGR